MNIYVPEEIKKSWPNLEFRGKPWKRNDLTWIRVKHYIYELNWARYFCFEWNRAVCEESYLRGLN